MEAVLLAELLAEAFELEGADGAQDGEQVRLRVVPQLQRSAALPLRLLLRSPEFLCERDTVREINGWIDSTQAIPLKCEEIERIDFLIEYNYILRNN
jgi:hypothetical protein